RHEKHKPHDKKEDHGHCHSNTQVRNKFAEHETTAAQRTNEQLLERATFPFAHECHCGSDCCPDLQDNPDHARHVKVRCTHCRVVKHLRSNIDRHSLPAGVAQKR